MEFDIFKLLGQVGNEALDSAEADIKKASEILKGLGL